MYLFENLNACKKTSYKISSISDNGKKDKIDNPEIVQRCSYDYILI